MLSVDLYRSLLLFMSTKSSNYNFTLSLLLQIKQLWGQQVTVNEHHDTWAHKNIPWLWPKNKPLPKKFRDEIDESHLRELQKTDWTREKVNRKHFATHWIVALTFVLFLDFRIFGENLSAIPKNWRWCANCQQMEWLGLDGRYIVVKYWTS